MKKAYITRLINEEVHKVITETKDNSIIEEGIISSILGLLWSGKEKDIIKSIEKKYGAPIEPGLRNRITDTTTELKKLKAELEAMNISLGIK